MGFFYEARATECGRIGQVWLEGRRAAMDAAMFRQEFMGEFVDDGV